MYHQGNKHSGQQSNRFDHEQARARRKRALESLRDKVPGRDAWLSGFFIMVCLSVGIGFGSLDSSSSRYGSTQASIDSLVESQRRIQELQKNALALQNAAALQATLDSRKVLRQPVLSTLRPSPWSNLPPACLPPDEMLKAFNKAEAEAAIESIEPVDLCEPAE